MEIIKGYVHQIIPLDKQSSYMPRGWKEPFLDGKHQVVIEREDYPQIGFIKRLIFRFKHRKEEYYWVLACNKITFAEGDLIELPCERYYAETDLWLSDGTLIRELDNILKLSNGLKK